MNTPTSTRWSETPSFGGTCWAICDSVFQAAERFPRPKPVEQPRRHAAALRAADHLRGDP